MANRGFLLPDARSYAVNAFRITGGMRDWIASHDKSGEGHDDISTVVTSSL
jgi:hypothetical protein